jgi:type 1 fimbria pilin
MGYAITCLSRTGRTRFSRCALLLLLLVLSLAPIGSAFAQCKLDPDSPGAQGLVTFNPPSQITVPVNTPVNTVLWTSTEVTPVPAPEYDCYGTVKYGLVNNVGQNPAGNTKYFPTGVTGLSYVITHGGATLNSWPNSSENVGGECIFNTCFGGETITFSVTSTLQLVATGTIANGSTLQAGTLAYWQWTGFNSATPQTEAFILGNQVQFVTPSCSVTTNPVNVTLPTLMTTSFSGTGSTAGAVAFNIGLNCPSSASGLTLSVQLDYNGTASGIKGVLLPTTNTSKGIGVQLLNGSNQAVTFGTPAKIGKTTTGQMTIPYSAQYYQTGAITPGPLTASATFTLSYQ